MFNWLKKISAPREDRQASTPIKDTVQYLVVRQDLDMSPGKMAAQAAHASSKIVLSHFGRLNGVRGAKELQLHQSAFQQWQDRSFAKVVLRVKSRDQLLQLCDQLESLNIPFAPIFDACRTELTPEEPNGSVFTCIGITPLFRDEVPKCLQKLQVYK
jgi:peptidyl-tRNA hydrolase, PTH2 family